MSYEKRVPQLIETETFEYRQKPPEPKSPFSELGNIALGYVLGGALAGPTVMPRTEALTLEMIAGTVEYADIAVQEENGPL